MEKYSILVDEEEIVVEKKELQDLDLVRNGQNAFHLLQDNKSHAVELVEADFLRKTLKIAVNGNTYQLKIEDEYDLQVRKMGLLRVSSQKVNSVKAPMSGQIIEVMVEEGQEVSEGTPMLVLSAMKMENIIVSQAAGVIKEIRVGKDDTVQKGQLMVEME